VKNSKTPQISTAQNKQPLRKHRDNAVVIYFDGAGSSFDGKGSGFAWIRPLTRERYVERRDGLTSNQAEYHGLISSLNSLARGSVAQVFTDSQLLCSQISGHYKVCNSELAKLLSDVHELIKKKDLKIEVQWVPRQKNLAGKLL
jgi:ribonuclease HI